MTSITKGEKLLRKKNLETRQATHNPRPAQHRKKSPDTSMFTRLKANLTAMALNFRHIEPNWRNYIRYVDLAAQDGDEEMEKVMRIYSSLPPREQKTIMPEKLCDLAGVSPRKVIAAVAEQLWANQQSESVITASVFHPRMVEATAYFGGMYPDNNKDRELFFRLTGGLPDKKGTSIVINNNSQTAHVTPSFAGANGFKPMDTRVIEMGKLLDSTPDTKPLPPDEETDDVFAEDD